MASNRVPLLVGVAVIGTVLLTATALGAVTQGGVRSGHLDAAARITSSVTQNGVQVKASAGSSRVAGGSQVPLTVTVRSDQTQVTVVYVEAYDPLDKRVFQRTWTAQTLDGGRSSTWNVAWTTPKVTWTTPSPAGRYRIAVGVFTGGWGRLLAWNNRAAYVVVSPPATRSEPGSAADEMTGGGTASASSGGSAPPRAGAANGEQVPGAPAAGETGPMGAGPAMPGRRKGQAAGAPPAHGRAQGAAGGPSSDAAPDRFTTRPAGSALPSGEQCAQWVRAVAVPPEIKAVNDVPNASSGAPLKDATGLLSRVDGSFTGTTEQILRWVACKWGIDEDVVKAQAAVESSWRMDTRGDWNTDEARCAPGHGLGVDGREGACPESFGLLQIRYPFHRIAFPGAITSTALNVDYAYAQWRDCFEGNQTWLNSVEHGSTYGAGDLWGCVGVWDADHWHTAAADKYSDKVKGALEHKAWTADGFRED
ncbi:MAG TPA: hypothetical protein VI248_03665 [Kineosporiaceae bacterium]